MAYDEHHDDEYSAAEGGLYASAAATGPDPAARHRRRLMAGTIVAVVALATAGFLATRLMNERQSTLPEPAALAPQTTPATAVPAPVDTAPVTRTPAITRHAAPVERSPAPSAGAGPGASSGPGADPGGAAASAAIDELRERLRINSRTRTATYPYEDGRMTVVAARRDVSGESLLKRAQDAGTPAGNGIRCTTRVSNEPEWEPGRPPTLMCWRTSAARSVVVVSSASTAGAEAVRISASLIETEWPKRD